MEQDKELKAMSDIIATLNGLENSEKKRVIKYVLDRLNIEDTRKEIMPENTLAMEDINEKRELSLNDSILDIRSLKEQKNPKSAIQMAVLVAYYLQEVSPIEERKEGVGTKDIEKFFKQAQYRLPAGIKGAADVLNNAKRSGYLEAAGYGVFKLNPVGYNLIVHGLPEAKSDGYKKRTISKKRSKKR